MKANCLNLEQEKMFENQIPAQDLSQDRCVEKNIDSKDKIMESILNYYDQITFVKGLS